MVMFKTEIPLLRPLFKTNLDMTWTACAVSIAGFLAINKHIKKTEAMIVICIY